MKQYCFISSMFRSGSTLVARMLNSHDCIVCASDPMRPLVNSFRYDIADEKYKAENDRFAPLSDYFAKDSDLLRRIIDGSLDLKVGIPSGDLIRVVSERAKTFSGNWADALNPELNLSTYSEFVEYFFGLIEKVYGQKKEVSNIAFKEVWATEFYPALKRQFSSIKCIAIVRDPRAVVASRNATGEPYPYFFMGRQWRKLAYLAAYFKHEYKDDILILRYEDLVSDPEHYVPKMCSFLNVEYDDDLLDMSRYKDGRGNPWFQNTSYKDIVSQRINSKTIDKWRDFFDKRDLLSIELFTYDWMKFFGYRPELPIKELMDLEVKDFKRIDISELADWVVPYSFDEDYERVTNELEVEKMRLKNDTSLSADQMFQMHLKWW